VGGPVPPVRQSEAGGRLCWPGTNTVEERLDRSRTGGVQGGQPAAEDNNGRAGLAMVTGPANLGTQSVVSRAGPATWWTDGQNDDRGPGAQAPHRLWAISHRRCRH